MKWICNHFRYLCVLVLATLLGIGCAAKQISSDPQNGVGQHTPNVIQSITPTFIHQPISTLESRVTETKPEVKPSITPLIENNEDEIQECNMGGVAISEQAGFGFEGMVIYQDADHKGLYKVGGNPLRISKLPVQENNKYQIIGLSTNGEWLAFTPLLSEEQAIQERSLSLKLLSFSGKSINKLIPFEPLLSKFDEPFQVRSWSSLGGGWLNNEIIALQIYYKPVSSEVGPDLPELLDPFVGDWKQDIIKQLKNGYFQHSVGFSGDLSRVLFTNNQGIVLMDIGTQNTKLITSNQYLLQPGAVSGPFYSWAPDSSKVVYGPMIPSSEYYKLILINRDGKEISEINPTKLLKDKNFWANYVKWSPDSTQIAIIGELQIGNNTTSQKLYVYDVSEGKFIYQCPLATNEPVSELFWSPDKHHLLLNTSGPAHHLILYNIVDKQVVQLTVKGIVGGWSDKFQ